MLFSLVFLAVAAVSLVSGISEKRILKYEIDVLKLKLLNCPGYVKKLQPHEIIARSSDALKKRLELKLTRKTFQYLKSRYVKYCTNPKAPMSIREIKIHLEATRFQIEETSKSLRNCLGYKNKFNRPGILRKHSVKYGFVNWQFELELAKYMLQQLKDDQLHCIKSIDNCKNKPCKNGGTCQKTAGSFRCSCKLGFTGKTCSERTGCSIVNFKNVENICSGRNSYETWMKDGNRFYYLNGYSGIKQMSMYNSKNDMCNKKNSVVYTFPGFTLYNTDHIVYKKALYSLVSYTTSKIMRYDLDTGVKTTMDINRGKCTYNWGGYSYVDFAVDELGLWIIYGNPSNCKMMLSKIDPLSLKIQKTWTMLWTKNSVGNAFMVCGKLYVINSYYGSPVYIKYTFDTYTGGSDTLGSSTLPLSKARHLNNVNYNKHDHKIYTWDYYLGPKRYSITFK